MGGEFRNGHLCSCHQSAGTILAGRHLRRVGGHDAAGAGEYGAANRQHATTGGNVSAIGKRMGQREPPDSLGWQSRNSRRRGQWANESEPCSHRTAHRGERLPDQVKAIATQCRALCHPSRQHPARNLHCWRRERLPKNGTRGPRDVHLHAALGRQAVCSHGSMSG